MPRISVSAIKAALKKVLHKVPAEGRKALLVQAGKERGFATLPFRWATGKVVGKKRLDKFISEHIDKPLVNMELLVGSALRKIKPKWFTEKLKVPSRLGKGLYKEIEVPSGFKPIKSVSKMVTPFAAGLYLTEQAEKLRKRNAAKIGRR